MVGRLLVQHVPLVLLLQCRSGGLLFSSSALAATPANNQSLTITRSNSTSASYKAYQLFTGVIDDTNNTTSADGLNFGSDIADPTAFIAFLDSATGPAGVAGDYTAWLAQEEIPAADKAQPLNVLNYLSDRVSASAGNNNPVWVNAGTFADKLAQYFYENGTGSALSGNTFTGTEGWYLFLTDAASLSGTQSATAPIFAPVGGNVSTITEKNAPVTLLKLVKEDSTGKWGKFADAELGQLVDYKITATIPDIDGYDKYKTTFTDTLPAGQQLEDVAKVTVWAGDSDDTDADMVDVTSFFTSNYSENKLVVKNTDDDIKNDAAVMAKLADGGQLQVRYKAKLTGLNVKYGTAEGNENTSYFEFSNSPNTDQEGTPTTGRTQDSDAKVYVYGSTISKVDKSANDKPLAGAQFVVKNQEDKYLVFNATSGEGSWSADTTDAATKFTTGEDGTVQVKGLDEGVYTFTEVAPPAGYRMPANPDFTVTITRTLTETATDAGYTEAGGDGVSGFTATGPVNNLGAIKNVAAESDASNLTLEVNNKQGSLAITGAEGVGLGGVFVVLLGIGLYILRRRRGVQAQ